MPVSKLCELKDVFGFGFVLLGNPSIDFKARTIVFGLPEIEVRCTDTADALCTLSFLMKYKDKYGKINPKKGELECK